MDVTQACAETSQLLEEKGLLQQGWRFKLGRGKQRLGLCCYRTKTISIGHFHILHGTDDEVRNTIRHEVAHAIAGGAAKHGPVWRLIAQQLGARPEPKTSVSYHIPLKYGIFCGMCGEMVARQQRAMKPEKLARSWHSACGRSAKGMLTISELAKATT